MAVGKFTEYKLQLKSMAEGSERFDYHLDKTFFEKMENGEVRDANLEVALSVENRGGVYTLDFAISGEITVLCDRCLDEMALPIKTNYHIIVKYGEEYNDESDELLEIPESDNYLNVAYMINDTVTLAIPIKHVHAKGKCNSAMSEILKKHRAEGGELDAESGGEPPIDPRWDALKKLTENN